MKKFCSNGKDKRQGLKMNASLTNRILTRELASVGALTQENIQKANTYSRASEIQVEELRLTEWCGFTELTDECKFGLALFELSSPHLTTTVIVPLKDMNIQRTVNITLMQDISAARVCLKRGGYVSMPLQYADTFGMRAIAQFVHETVMVGKLVEDICTKKSAKDRWLPNFIDDIEEIEKVLNDPAYVRDQLPPIYDVRRAPIKYTTIGQYLVLAMCERIRKRIKFGIGLRSLFYSVSLISRFALDGNFVSMNTLIMNVVMWISEGTCDDCLISMMRILRGNNHCEYNLFLEDSFSKYIMIQHSETINITFGPSCTPTGIADSPHNMRKISVRTIGTHAFLTSPEAERRVKVAIGFTENYPMMKLYPTLRQAISLRTIMDLHARVLRAHSWGSSVAAFNAWFSDRRITLDTSSNDLLDVMIKDLCEIRKLNLNARAAASHVICLLIRGVLPKEMVTAYNFRPKNERAHEFLVRFVFQISPSSIAMRFADMLFERFISATPAERRLEISFTLEN
ncbi:unnamed protein product [Arctia plantaginis]|uniref:Uncharacterized protein n=1 Tax=Arctia plantaginis TaxID=874455 RepID=A0A8S0ZZ21_ARCPL|nr:unnamed protein product [Arctia plantaginis]CAB3238379.1 unnamed protein product [Arctia plantaginis]